MFEDKTLLLKFETRMLTGGWPEEQSDVLEVEKAKRLWDMA